MQYVNCHRSDLTKVTVASEVKKEYSSQEKLCISIFESEKNKEARASEMTQ